VTRKFSEGPDILGGVTAGLSIILIAILLVITPNILALIVNFFTDFAFFEVYPGFFWWAPQNPHPEIYNLIYLFSLGTIIINIIVFFLRVIFRDSYRRQIESIGGIIFSIGATWAAFNLTLNNNFTGFIGYIIVFAGLSLIISSVGHFLLARYTT
jgi:hypothetical protein